MDDIKKTVDKLKKVVIGKDNLTNDDKIANAIKDISTYKINSGRSGYIDLVKTVIAKTTNDLTGPLNSFGGQPTDPAIFGQAERIARYKTYDAIENIINYCHRALLVLTDNIISPDDITKDSLQIMRKNAIEEGRDSDNDLQISVRKTISNIKLEENLSIIVKNTLKYGDFFCEIADTNTSVASKSYLSEEDQSESKINSIVTEQISDNDNSIKIQLEIDLLSLDETKNNKNNTKDLKSYNLIFHEPYQVIKLQSEAFPLCFGYLVFPKAGMNPQLALKDQMVNDICTKIINSVAVKLPEIKDIEIDNELKNVIKTMVQNTKELNRMRVRFVPTDRMEHFHIPSTKYFPYGESIFDSCQYTAKVLIALETALAVHRLARSTEKRKIAIEVGLPRDAKKLVEDIKTQFRKRKVSLDSFGSVDTIPSMISTFEDIYIPQKDGKPFVDINTFTEGNVDIRGKVDELKFLRDSLIASLNIPASFLNIEENLSNKAALTEENILFARAIVGHQKYLSCQLNKLLEKLYAIINPETALILLERIIIKLPSPKSLQFEREARYMSEISNMIETLERIGVPKEYSREKYIPSIDWREVEKFKANNSIDKNMGTTDDEQDGAAGGMGGGMGGF